LPRLNAALDIIGRYEPATLTWAQRRPLRIVLVWKGFPMLVKSHATIRVGAEWLSLQSAPFAAMQLVAQFAKARFVMNAPRAADVRLERAVFEHRITFCRKLPEADDLLEFLTRAWDNGLVLPSEDQMREGRLRNSAEAAETYRALPLPRWLRTLFIRQLEQAADSSVERPRSQ
jgi:hypothetical protein